MLKTRESDVKSILARTSGFIAQAGFTHSLNPARNCTFGCTYCYVPTMRIYAGLKREDWERWGQFTTFKSNAAGLLRRQLRPDQIIYCSPLVDPYQPVEAERSLMPEILQELIARRLLNRASTYPDEEADMPPKKKREVSLPVNREPETALDSPELVRLEKNLSSLCFFTPSSKNTTAASLNSMLICSPIF